MRTGFLVAVLLACAPAAQGAPGRVWTDSSGQFSVEAEFVELRGGEVVLKKADGRTVAVPLEKLSQPDREYVRQRAAAPAEKSEPAARASAGPARRGPFPFPPGPPPAQDPSREKQRLDEMEQIVEQRAHLLAEWDEASERVQSLLAGLQSAGAEYAGLEGQARLVRQRAANLQAQMRALEEQMGRAKDGGEAQRLRAVRDGLDAEYRASWRELQVMEVRGREVGARIARLNTELAGRRRDIERWLAEAAGLRGQWVPCIDPLGKLSREEHQRAAVVFSQWIAQHGRDPCPYLARGYAQLRLGDYGAAAADLDKAAGLDAELAPLALAGRGLALCRQGAAKEGMADFGKVLKLNKRLGVVYLFRGRALAEQGNYAMAATDFKTAAQLMPQSPEAHEAFAFLLATCPRASTREARQAVEHATTACKLSGWGDWACLRTLAAACAEAGDLAAARELIRKAMEFAPADEQAALAEQASLHDADKPYRTPEPEGRPAK